MDGADDGWGRWWMDGRGYLFAFAMPTTWMNHRLLRRNSLLILSSSESPSLHHLLNRVLWGMMRYLSQTPQQFRPGSVSEPNRLTQKQQNVSHESKKTRCEKDDRRYLQNNVLDPNEAFEDGST